jgi:hypothetical protein
MCRFNLSGCSKCFAVSPGSNRNPNYGVKSGRFLDLAKKSYDRTQIHFILHSLTIQSSRGGPIMLRCALFRMKFFAVFLIFYLISLPLCAAADAPGSERSWENLKQLKSGTRIQVVTMNGDSRKGVLVNVSDDDLVFRASKSDLTVHRADVHKVKNRDKNHHMRNGLIGMGIGAAIVGASAAANFSKKCSNCRNGAGGGILVGAIIGTIGFAFGNHKTVYEAEKITRKKIMMGTLEKRMRLHLPWEMQTASEDQIMPLLLAGEALA